MTSLFNGEYYLKAGEECEMMLVGAVSEKWFRATPLAYSDIGIYFERYDKEFGKCCYWFPIPGKGENLIFRPIRAAEEVKPETMNG